MAGYSAEDPFIYTGIGYVPRNVTHVKVHPSVTIITEKAFSCCYNLKQIDICEGLLAIESGAFYACRRMVSLELPTSLRKIHTYAFSNCISLRNVAWPPSAG